jgi:CRISPR-associated protein Cas1
MIKRTLYFGNPCYLSLKNQQLVVQFPNDDGHTAANPNSQIPVEDLGMVLLDHSQITITHSLMVAMLANKVILVSCDDSHHPAGMMNSLEGHSEQSKRMSAQIESSEPLRKNLWQQTVSKKLENQAQILIQRNRPFEPLIRWSKQVRSGDPDNYEGRGAAHYWEYIFPGNPFFLRDRHGHPPNAWLNYGYAVLRATMARAIVGAGLNPTLGIHHRNKYNAYCLADDLMEPYRPVADWAVCQLLERFEPDNDITKEVKHALLSLASADVRINGDRSPLMVAMQKTAVSVVKCYLGESRTVSHPDLIFSN